ncbi:cytochrome P450 [Nocardia sp. NPDC050713]|uniref:cytochrome P450 n=1 Tax=Nocardia sp. NPDC050713 TaxID=3154511 RepID=UPI0033E87490
MHSGVDEGTAFRPGPVLDGEGEPNTWLPFGGGAHRCIGAGFALMDRTAVLREVLTRHTLAPADSHPERGRVRNITTVPRGKARIVVTPQ